MEFSRQILKGFLKGFPREFLARRPQFFGHSGGLFTGEDAKKGRLRMLEQCAKNVLAERVSARETVGRL